MRNVFFAAGSEYYGWEDIFRTCVGYLAATRRYMFFWLCIPNHVMQFGSRYGGVCKVQHILEWC